MRLTKLEIKGFKSFAEKTVVHFNGNITGVVGPNGCGKSNIVDSIRWVLGEQKTSQLRLEKMDNVIFNGTKQRKAAGLAEVSLTFENTKNLIPTEYNIVTITRKLFRDGESEYRINEVQCRLKDIHNLFMDTGIGTDSYAIIELGMVDDILQDRDNSRRKLFEQAAGISKYKTRKKETLSKLKSTEEDLTRLQDILHEIEQNMKTLESQARRANRYAILKDEYKVVSLELVKLQLNEHKEIFSRTKENLQKEEENKTQIDAELATLEAVLEKEKLQYVDAEKALSAVQKRLNEIISSLGADENERNILKEKIKFSTEKVQTATENKQRAEVAKQQFGAEIQELQTTHDAEKTALDALKELVETSQAELEKIRASYQDIKTGLDSEKKQYGENEKAVFELEKKVAVNKTTLENLKREKEQYIQEKLFKADELETYKSQFTQVNAQKDTLQNDLQILQKSEEETALKIQQVEKKLDTVKYNLSNENRKLDAKKNEYQLTKSMVENLEGYPDSIKFLKKNSKPLKDAPLLSDIISCKEEYRVAIENFLEPWLNYYIVDSAEDATYSINLLHDASKGKANFFILSEVKNPSTEDKIFSPYTAAVDIIDVDKKYAPLFSILLKNVFIAEDLTEKEILDTANSETILLSKSGKYQKRPFALSGGAVGLFEGKKIGRVKNLEVLNTEVEQLGKNVMAFERETKSTIEELNALKNATKKNEIIALQNQLNQVLQQLTKVQTLMQQAENIVLSGSDKIQALEEKSAKLLEENNTIENTLQELKAAQEKLKSSLDSNDTNFAQLSSALTEKSALFNQHNISFHQKQNQVNTALQNIQFKTTQMMQQDEMLQKAQEDIVLNEKTVEECSLKLKEIETVLLSAYDNRGEFEKELQQAEQLYYKTRGVISEQEEALKNVHKKREIAFQLIGEFTSKLNELKLNISATKERLQLEFGVDINEVLNTEITSDRTPMELATDVAAMKKKLESFGEVNPMAVEAFNEIKTRYDFIISQKKDLIEAKESLLQTILEIDTNAKEKFITAFTEIRTNFVRVFRTLFTEDDDCDLILSDAENPLDADIDIIAKPKGKRPLSISQLSGGEKTLTATALLFSLYLLKPAPFCIFDEVDAPLDDTNIAKFNKIIQEFSSDSQFVIVTHNKQTMAAVDIIYGVTMPEQGVSRVVPVDFRSLN